MLFTKSITTSLLLAGCALAQDAPGVKVHVVQVSSTEKAVLKFSPNNVQAKVGDMVQFQFHTGNHTVTQSTFGKPCIPIKNVMPDVEGFFSGFMPVKQGATSQPTYTVPVKSEKPLWFYCSQGKHCQAGMVGAINAATTGNKTIEAFAALAAAAPENLAPGGSSGSSSSAYGSGSNTASASMSMSTTDASSTATESSASSTTTAGTTVQSKAASPKLLAGPQEVLTGLSMAALLSAVLL